MSIALQIGQIIFFLLLFALTFIFIAREQNWLGPVGTLLSDVENDFRRFFEKSIFDRLDFLNDRYESLWKRNTYLLQAADENEQVNTQLYEAIYTRLSETSRDWQELGKEIAGIFQETDAYIQECNTASLFIEAVKVKLRRSHLDIAASKIDRLAKTIHIYRDTYDLIGRIPGRVQKSMEALKKDIRECLLENIDVVESVKGERIESHLRMLATILKEREPMAERLDEIVQNKAASRADKEMLSAIHMWLIKAGVEVSNARAEFRAANQTFSDLSLMEKQVKAWHETYGQIKGETFFEEMTIDDLEKRVVALRELWEGYNHDFIELKVAGVEDRIERIHFILDEVERFDQDINFVKTCRSDIENQLSRLQQLGEISDWIEKTAALSPFAIEFQYSKIATNRFEKAIIGWDNPRPYDDVPAFVEHAKRMEGEINLYGTALSELKEKFRFIKNIESFYSTLKNGILKQQTSEALAFYRYANEESSMETIEWQPFEQLLDQVELLLQDNPVASAKRHDPIPEENIPAIYDQVEKFKFEWEQALGAIQENYKLMQSILRKDIELMGAEWQEFVYSIQNPAGRGYTYPYHVISIAEPNGKLSSMLNNDAYHSELAELGNIDLMACHKELSRLSRDMKNAVEKAERILIKHKAIKNVMEQCTNIVQRIQKHPIAPDDSVAKRIQEYTHWVERFDDVSELGDTYESLWDTLGLLENAIRLDLLEFKKISAALEQPSLSKTHPKTSIKYDSTKAVTRL